MPVHERIPGQEKPEMERRKDEQVLPELSSQVVTMITTEHYNLQTGRSMTVADANGRSTLFIGAVSGALIAIAFAGQVSHMGTAFFVFSLVLVPSLFLMGLITFERVLQSAIEDLTYARGITRIRRLYLEYAPQLRPYFLLSTDDEKRRPVLKVGIHPSWWQVFLTTAGMIAAINSVLVGVFAYRYRFFGRIGPTSRWRSASRDSFPLGFTGGFVSNSPKKPIPVRGVFVGLLLSALFTFSLLVCTCAGALTFLVSFGIHQRYQWRRWRRLEQNLLNSDHSSGSALSGGTGIRGWPTLCQGLGGPQIITF